MKHYLPRILIAALRGGAGKSVISLGLLAAWKGAGKRIAAFKKGPDYIDASWLSRATGLPCYNLDTYLMDEKTVYQSFLRRTLGMDGAIIEGNRGLFDGMDAAGSHSSAALAHLLSVPVILVLDCTKATRTLAASVLGCQKMDPTIDIRGVILNRVGGKRHVQVVEECIKHYCGVRALGSIPRQMDLLVPERYLGLLPPQEHLHAEEVIHVCKQSVEDHLDLQALWDIAKNAPEMELLNQNSSHGEHHPFSDIRIGVMRDSSFHFYYPENIEALEAQGGKVIDIQAAEDVTLPDLDALYIGGGFPEMQAALLSRNHSFQASVREAVERGLPVYAECGGAMYLGKGIEVEGAFYPMTGIFPVVFSLSSRPQGHGYTLLEVEEDNPYFSAGTLLKGHEFHYSSMASIEEDHVHFVCSVKRGYGFDGIREGLCYKNVFATFSHIHALGEHHWAKTFLQNASWYQQIHTIH